MSKALSLSLGLRWDLAPPPKGEHGQDAYTILGEFNTPATLRSRPGVRPFGIRGGTTSLPVLV